jgi:arylsulfatase A-like enzyme
VKRVKPASRTLAKFFAFLFLAQVTFAAEPRPPNIVFFLADDLGYMDIGANNPKTFYETPNIDALAKRGMRFTQGYAASPVCSPTRASIMTGKSGAHGHHRLHRGQPSGEAETRPEPGSPRVGGSDDRRGLARRGLHELLRGKWHLGTGEYSPNSQGFGPGLVGQGQFFYPPTRCR